MTTRDKINDLFDVIWNLMFNMLIGVNHVTMTASINLIISLKMAIIRWNILNFSKLCVSNKYHITI